MTAEEYRNYLETDFDDVDLKELKDIRKIRIDRNQTKEKRIAQYLRQVGNPYLVCIGNVKSENKVCKQMEYLLKMHLRNFCFLYKK